MFFAETDFSVKLLSVFSLDWKSNNTAVAPRPYNALSFRLVGDAEFEGENGKVRVGNNALLFMPENVGYYLRSGAEKLVVVHFELNGKKQNFFESFVPDKPEIFCELFLSLCEIWEGKKTGYMLRATSVFYRILEEMVRGAARLEHSADYDKIKPAVSYMNRHYTDSALTVETLCSLCGMSDTYFRRLFFREFGMTPLKYLTDLRIGYAKELLSSGYYTVRQVASNVGFEDAKYFCTVFRKKCGCTPSEFAR